MNYLNEEIVTELIHKKEVAKSVILKFPVMTKNKVMLSDRDEVKSMIKYLKENYDYNKPKSEYHDSLDHFSLRKMIANSSWSRFDDSFSRLDTLDIATVRELVSNVRSLVLKTSESLDFWSTVPFKVPSERSDTIYKNLEIHRTDYPHALNIWSR